MRRSGVLAFVVTLAASSVEAGPWPIGRGKLYAKLSYQYLRATTLAAPDGTEFDIPAFREDYVDLYGAFGVDDRLTFIATVPILRSTDLADDPDELRRQSGFGDLRLGVQAQLGKRGPWVFAVRGLVQAPTGDETVSRGLQATGSGVWEGEASIGAGSSLASGKAYGFLEVGYQARGAGFRDGFLYTFQVGWNAHRRLILAANLRGVQPWRNRPGDAPAGAPAGFGDGVTYTVYGPTAIVRLGKGWGLQVDVEGALNARNLATGPLFRAGFTFSTVD